MGKEVDRIADQFRRAFDGEAWHGPSVLPLLNGVTAEQAAARPIPGAHTIWELTQHIRAWESACLRRLNGDPAQLPDSEDWVAINDFSEASWEQAKQGLVDTHNQLLAALASLDDSRLDQPIMEYPEIPFSSTYVTLHGGVQHDLYHAGQIAILKKALGIGVSYRVNTVCRVAAACLRFEAKRFSGWWTNSAVGKSSWSII
jgi:uncharacterized damage-inducible protein DinB